MSNTLKLSHYSVEIYNYWHSTSGLLETDKAGKIIGCLGLKSYDGWSEKNSGNADEILSLIMNEANKAISYGEVPAELPEEKGPFIKVAYLEHGGNCAYIFANYDEDEDEEDAE